MKTYALIIVLISFAWCSTLQAQVPFVCKGQYFLSLHSGGNSGLFYVELDENSGTTIFDPIAADIGANMNAIGYRKTDNFIYGVTPWPNSLRLYRVGLDGVAVDLGIPQDIDLSGYNYYAGDITPDGNFLILLAQSGTAGVLAFVDLNDPNYQTTSLPLNSAYGGIYDIAFDPFSGELYGFSTSSGRLVTIDTTTGSVESNFPEQSQVNQMGALFFDVSGSLFGYGSIFGASTLVEINIETGIMVGVANGPPSGGEDGCSCPYTVEFKKRVSTDIALPCTEIIYTFEITNSSGTAHSGVQLNDFMPEQFTVLDVLYNPYGGTVFMEGSILDISGMNILPGTDSIQVLVEVNQDALGLYENQAVLLGLPTSLGDFILSDNPLTEEIPDDSTPIVIEPLDVTFVEEEYMLCPGETLPINVMLYGVTYLWEDGSESPWRQIDTAGNYSVSITSGCDQVIADFEVVTNLDYTFLEERFFFCKNDLPEVDVSAYGQQYLWEDGSDSASRVFQEPRAYSVTVTNGCDITVIDYEVIVDGFFLNILEENITVELGEYANLNAIYWANNNTVSFNWFDPLGNSVECIDCLSTIAQPTADVTYSLVMTLENGCSYFDEILVEVTKDRSVYIPNIISPNGDGNNDYFYVQSKRDNVKINTMSIFDRWGSLVFESKDIPLNQELVGWDGKLNGEATQSSVFVYMIEFEFIDGHILSKTGDVTVVR